MVQKQKVQREITERKNSASQDVKLKYSNEMLSMNFCPKCGKLLKVVRRSLPALQCPKCGYKTEFKSDNFLKPNLKITNHTINEIAVIDNEASGLRTSPTIGVVCAACGKAGSETWTVAVGSEGTTSSFTFFKCTSCGFTRREAE
jgi:DNA-directed RNA polymerase subunit M/transcription elongation factor TFIIS